MYACLDLFDCGEHLVVRIGPECTDLSKPWVKKLFGEITGSAVRIVAYDRDPDDPIEPRLTPDMVEAARAAILNRFESVDWKRKTNAPRTIEFRKNPTGEITMHKVPHTDRAKKGGNIDPAIVEADASVVASGLKDGTLKLLGLHTTDLSDNVRATTFVVQTVK